MQPDVGSIKRLRGMIVEVLYDRHAQQQHRIDHVILWHILQDLGRDVSENEALTALQDMSDRGYVRYEQTKDRKTGAVNVYLIQLTARGRDLREETISDPAVLF